MLHLIIARPTSGTPVGASLRYMHFIARLLAGTPILLCQEGERLGTQRRTIAEEFLWGMLRGGLNHYQRLTPDCLQPSL
jgi:hypothetical protein